MIVRANTAVSFPVMFASGQPDGAVVTYKIYNPLGVVISSGAITVSPGSVSTAVRVSVEANTLAEGEIISYRDVEWSYTTNGDTVTGEARYTIEARLPFGVSADGVRAKLGVDSKDLPDSDISLAKAYLGFQTKAIVPLSTIVDPNAITIIGDAIEAAAALILIPTMTVRVAAKESSGTNQYQRQGVEWADVKVNLEAVVAAGYLAANPLYDPTSDFGSLLLVVSPAVDAITGV